MAASGDERRIVRDFLNYLADHYPGGWDSLIHDAGISSTTAQDWRYGEKGSTPRAPHLLNILQAVGVLNEDYRLPDEWEQLGAAQQAVAAAGRKAQRLEQPSRSDSARPGKKQSSR